MCVLSIKVPIRKKSGNLFNDLRSLGDKRHLTFPKGISSTMNLTVLHEFELAYLEAPVHHLHSS